VAIAILDHSGRIKSITYDRLMALNPSRLKTIRGRPFHRLPWYEEKDSKKIAGAIRMAAAGEAVTIEFRAIDINNGEAHHRRAIFVPRGAFVAVKIFGESNHGANAFSGSGARRVRGVSDGCIHDEH